MKRLVLVCALVLLAALVLPSSAFAGNLIAFTGWGEGEGDIGVVSSDGTGLKWLTADGVSSSPSWSPDGSKLAFLRVVGDPRYDDPTEIWTMTGSGTGQQRVVTSSLALGDVAWSPDGRYLAYSDIDYDAEWTRLLVKDLQTGAVRVLWEDYTVDGIRSVDWSPDGRKIAISVFYNESAGAKIVDVATGAARTAAEQYAWSLSWSRRSGRLAYATWDAVLSETSRLTLTNYDGGGWRKVLSGWSYSVSGPSWSPDDSWIVFSGGRSSTDTGLFLVHPDGTGLKKILEDRRAQGFAYVYSEPQWQPYVQPVPTGPKVVSARFTNPIAFELKSMLTSRMVFRTDKANVNAKLVLKTASGDVTVFNNTVANTANTDYWLPAWNGLVAGKRLPSASYTWVLTLTKNGLSTTKTGKVTISKVLFGFSGTSKAGASNSHAGYMVPGNANVYISAKSTIATDRLTAGLKGPYGFTLPTRFWAVGTSPLSTTSYYKDGSAVRYRGMHTWTVTGRTAVTYTMTIIQ